MNDEAKKDTTSEVTETIVTDADKNKKKQNLIIAGIVGLIAVVGIGGYFMMNRNNEKIDYEKCVTGLRNWTIEEGTKDPDYLKGVKWDKEYIKKVTVDDDKVKTDKQGTYEITYLIDIKDEKEKDIEKEYKVKVISEEEAKKEADKGKEVVTDEGIKNEKKTEKPKSESTVQKEEPNKKPSKPSSNEGNTGSAEKPKPNHTHKWVEQFKTIHHDAVYENKYVVDQSAFDEQVPITEMKAHSICNGCGADITGNTTAHIKQGALEGTNCRGYHTEWIEEVVGYETVHHPEQGHNEQVLVKEAWDEKVSAGYKCSCGATK